LRSSSEALFSHLNNSSALWIYSFPIGGSENRVLDTQTTVEKNGRHLEKELEHLRVEVKIYITFLLSYSLFCSTNSNSVHPNLKP
jgi:hypothetical protein